MNSAPFAELATATSPLGKDLDETQRLELGHFVLDQSAAAIANGDRFFQRHASILGSTGSGKSWCVSLILERANARKYSNIIVFDMHGEYASLCTPTAPSGEAAATPFASQFKIAGPGDLGRLAQGPRDARGQLP